MNDNLTAEEVKGLRRLAVMSQSEFAKELGVSVDAVRKWEYGLSHPSRKALRELGKLARRIKKEETENA